MAPLRHRFIRDSNFYIYADISLEFELNKIDLCARKLKLILMTCLEITFGHLGASIPIDILKFRESDCRAYLRFPASELVRVSNALTLLSEWDNKLIHIIFHKLSHSLSCLPIEPYDQKHQFVEDQN